MKGVISVVIFVPTLQIFIFSVETYKFICPLQAHWKLRAKEKCNSTLKYFCLYNNVKGKYVEGCNGPDWDRKGSKRIYAGNFTRGKCIQKRYQPFKFWTNESMFDCIYSKSICSEVGQIVNNEDSPKDDRTCRCDYKKNYSFIKTPRNHCFCIPTEEDCSCYNKYCPVNFTLSADYECIRSGYQGTPKCTDITKKYETFDEKDHFRLNETSSELKRKDSITVSILFCLCFIYVIVSGLIITILSLKRYIERSQTVEHTTDDVYFLRMVHLLFRVACPVVRMIFNHEIQPNMLRKTLDTNKAVMEKRYRKRDTIINDSQWDLLFGYDKGKTVTSEDFDIRLMILLLRTLANFKVGDTYYPVQADTSIGAMLSRIKFVRNAATQKLDGKLSENQFNKYWNDIGQAVLKLVYSCQHKIDNAEEKARLFDRLHTLNPIKIDDNELSKFIMMSEIYPAMILEHLISEYCTINKLKIEELLRDEKHDLYHKRIKTKSCCKCNPIEFPTFVKVITEKQWETLYEIIETKNSLYSCPCEKQCCNSFVPKKIDTSDLSVSVLIILYIPNILKHVISRLCVNGFNKFLVKNKHTIFHSMEKTKCCKCTRVPTEKTVMNKKEWNTLFMKDESKSCHLGNTDCCCQYSVRTGIKYEGIKEVFWSKLFHVAGPISVINKSGQTAFSYFLNWTVNGQPLRRALKELLKIIDNREFRNRMLQQISSVNLSKLDKTIEEKINANGWVSRHILDLKTPTDSALHILVRNKGDLNVKGVQIPKDIPLPNRIKKFTDITGEENNFLVVVHGLTKIVYPMIKKEFTVQCPDEVLDKIRMGIYDEYCQGENEGRKNKINLTQIQKDQLFSPNKEELKNLDLKLMIYILKQRPNCKEEEKKIYVDQLDVINNIRREIVQSSSGILNDEKFQDILERIKKAVLYLGGEKYEEELTSLLHIKNILE